MSIYKRFGIYVVPQGAFYDAGAAWLGWDSAAGRRRAQPQLPGLPETVERLTQTARKYGFHGTVKPPFRLAEGKSAAGLGEAVAAFCATQPSVTIPHIALHRLGRFLALVPATSCAALSDLAAATVQGLDGFRAPLDDAELARRRKSGLTDQQERLLSDWGYPYVMDQFRFHMTLTGPLAPAIAAPVEESLTAFFAPHLDQPLVIDSLALLGEAGDGSFHLLHRYTLSG
ncbi:DUF1045 domain-containing protein [Rhodophyticola sp. CCM32]|uniref:DUF1045 domain-containing protein n=1 Tax=Rhodophyticola sp. CCM32 TaxID=2916397 RepID=UPI00107F7582|nr:DUF1045 domain-containing protein [Rhodophyticola sp. CCM32]QBY01229.1 DUF1045 domain-containing protein [Rhodophyticola sp. CCM32]